jgi:hypothetical protein
VSEHSWCLSCGFLRVNGVGNGGIRAVCPRCFYRGWCASAPHTAFHQHWHVAMLRHRARNAL